MNKAASEIVQRENPVLRGKARAVSPEEIGGEYIEGVIKRMSASMHSQEDGAAIAAPQIGEPIMMFMVNGALLKKADSRYKGPASDIVYINPRIVKASREKADMEEGCLSVRWLYGKVRRSTRVNIEAVDRSGATIKRGASGLLAQIFQHECDHLEGVLFTDKAKEVWEMSEEEIEGLKIKN